jgi:inner membrane protease ATP23
MSEKTAPEKIHDDCVERIEHTLRQNSTVQLLIDSIESLGCKIPPNFFVCRNCDGNVSGGLAISQSHTQPPPQIVMCENAPMEPETFANTLIHELIHAYDVCRVKKFDMANCLHHACAEVRASSLSGECNFLHEIGRGNFALPFGHKQCVERRAILSVSTNPSCQVPYM